MATTIISTLSLHDALPIYNSCIISKGLISLGYKIPLRGSTPTRFRQFLGRLACPPCRFSRPSQYRRSEGTFGLTKRSEEHTSELQSHSDLVCRLLLEKKKI